MVETCPECGCDFDHIEAEHDMEFGIWLCECQECGCKFMIEEVVTIIEHGEQEE